MTGDISIVSLIREAPGTRRAEARDAAQYPTVHRTTPMTMKKLVQNVHNTKVEKPWFMHKKLFSKN